MAVSPSDMFVLRGACRIKQRWLSDEHERLLRIFSLRDLPLRVRDFFKSTTHMNRSGATARLCFPRDRLFQCIINLEHARSVSETLQPPDVTPRQPVGGQLQQLPRSQVQKYSSGGRKLSQAF